MAGLSEARQQELVEAIANFTREKGYAPSVGDLRAMMGLNGRSYLTRLLNQLRDAGRVEWEPRRTRTIRVISQDR